MLYFAANYIPGDPASLGRQGRYFSPLAPLLFLALTGMVVWREKLARAVRWLSLALLVAVLAGYGFGLYATYYTYCGSALYTGVACVQPIYKNLDKDTMPEILLTRDAALAQSFTSVCGEVASVEVLIRSVPQTNKGGVRLTVLSQDGETLAVREAGYTEINPGQYWGVNLAAGRQPAANAAGRYRLRIEQLPGTDEPGPGIGVAYRDDYSLGALFIAGNERGTDLIFHYSCALPARSGSK
jgi:hypothetical protein